MNCLMNQAMMKISADFRVLVCSRNLLLELYYCQKLEFNILPFDVVSVLPLGRFFAFIFSSLSCFPHFSLILHTMILSKTHLAYPIVSFPLVFFLTSAFSQMPSLTKMTSLLTKFIRQPGSYPFCISIYIIAFTTIFKWIWNCSLFRLIRFYNFLFCVYYTNLRHNYRMRDKNIFCILCAFDGTSRCEGHLGSCQASGWLFGIRIRTRVVARNIIKAVKPSIAVGCPPRVYAITAHTTYYIFSRISCSTYI